MKASTSIETGTAVRRTPLSLLAAASLGLVIAAGLAQAQPAAAPDAGTPSSVGAPQGPRHSGMGNPGGRGHHGQGNAEQREAMRKLVTPEERAAFREQMRSASPEQRQALRQTHRAELENRAKAQGMTLPQRHGGRGKHARKGAQPPA
jgi:hypothetical protein